MVTNRLLFARLELTAAPAPPAPANPTGSVRVHCTDCHAITPAPAGATACPVCACPRIYVEPAEPR